MSGVSPRNNTDTLRIRTSPPRNSRGMKKIWNGSTWISSSNAIAKERARVFELRNICNKSAANYKKLYKDIQEYKSMGAGGDELKYLTTKLSELYDKAKKDENIEEEARQTYLNLRNLTVTPMNKRRNRKTRKSNTRR